MVSFFFGSAQVSYEYMPFKRFGMGCSVAYSYKEEHDVRGLILPYFRYYIQNNPLFESFVEINSGLVVSSHAIFEETGSTSMIEDYEMSSAFGLGGAFGFKITPYYNLLLELKLGVGRDFNDDFDTTFYLRPAFCVGYRFVKKHHWNYKYGDKLILYD
jgi:hypothetical protein